MATTHDFPSTMGKVAPRELIENGIKNLRQTTDYEEKELLAIHGVGPKTIRIIKEELAKNGLQLKSERPTTQDASTTKPRIYTISFAGVYPLYVEKAEKKQRTKAEVNEIILWLTGYSQKELEKQIAKGVDLEAFYAQAPRLNPNRKLITGVICGVRVEDIEEQTMQEIRYLDKLVDELARGKKMEKILRK